MLQSFARLQGLPPHRSFFHDRLLKRSGGLPLDEWLVAQANARGFYGAFGVAELPADMALGLEDLLIGLIMPQGIADPRLFKLALRILQSGRLELKRLHLIARRERADLVLWWLVHQAPREERNEPVQRLLALLGQRPPRGYRPLPIRYDSTRLLRRRRRAPG